MKLKVFFITLLISSSFLTFARVNYPVFRTPKPSVLVRPQSQYTSLLLNLEPRLTYFLEESSQKTNWIDLDLIGSFEISPFSLKNLNVGLQTTIGSSGWILHTVGKWILFPDYKLQPALGVFADAYTGFSSLGQFLIGSNLQLLIQKSFNVQNPFIEDWGIYFAPLLRLNSLETDLYNIDWISGLNFNFDETPFFNSQWSLSIENRYNISFFEIGLRFLIYIQ